MILSLLKANAQTMVDTGKVWNVAKCLNFGPCGTTNYSFGADTTIGLHQYKLLIVDDDSGAFWAPYEPIAIREDTTAKQIFFYIDSGESLIYDFSISQGASYTITFMGCNLSITADSVDTVVLLSGESRKRMWVTITTLGGSCFSSSYTEIWIEGIGSLLGLTRAAYFAFVADVYPELICFHENDTLKYHSTNYSSCFFTTVGVKELTEESQIKIFPNPASESISVQTSNSLGQLSHITILNSVGQIVMTSKPSNNIDLHELTSGLYFIQATNSKGIFTTTKFQKL